MQKIFLYLSVIITAITFCSCEEKNVSGVAPYHCEYVLCSMSELGSDEMTTKLRNALLKDMATLKNRHNLVWDYQFEGSSVDEALKSQDKLALSYYEDAVKELNELKEEFDALTSAQEDWGKGSFSYTYKYRVYRLDKVLAESDEVTFSYRRRN